MASGHDKDKTPVRPKDNVETNISGELSECRHFLHLSHFSLTFVADELFRRLAKLNAGIGNVSTASWWLVLMQKINK